MRARRREGARWLLQLPLSLLLSLSLPLLPPPETARGACSSVDVRGGRAWLLLLPPRSAERGPTSEEGGRSGGLGGCRCVCGVPADSVERAWERAQRGRVELGHLFREPCAPPQPSEGVFQGVFWDQARFSDLGFPPLCNPERRSPGPFGLAFILHASSSPLSLH